MASFKVMAFLAVLVVVSLPMTTLGLHDDLSPALAPFYEKVCEEVDCGKGACKADIKYPFSYICECDAGWKRSQDNDIDEDLRFLPCIIPNCTLNYGTCQPAPPPVPEKEVPHNVSFYDPCYWIYCGEGALGSDCGRLGITVSRQESDDGSQGDMDPAHKEQLSLVSFAILCASVTFSF
ncbi:hypothetical protein JRO89_XS04G0167100 [Xanthoceras sorbifolium]|uniref:Uncharacterized protein n=1 Tax=Xanthoceras sorbifolium TaxID=99658 RepID=A0ABQ8I5K6_9ROSI|nr:hypothetical protein JRO89_XS04G0167100 [Xanthoceras sorbifolium]